MLKYARFQFCPSCGKSRVEEFKRNGMRCKDCGFLYFHNCASAAAAIIETKKGIVVTVRAEEPKSGFYDLPGGFVNYGESIEQALIREVREELNLEINDLRYFGSFPNIYYFHGITYFTTDAMFLAKAPSLARLRINKEVSEIFFAKPGEIDLDKIAFESIKNGVRRYLEVFNNA